MEFNIGSVGIRFLTFFIGTLLLCQCVGAQKRPPNYSQDDMPITSFSCKDKIVGGYYADPETDCQMFHVCVRVPGVGIQNFRFLCPNDTTFDQEHQICDDWYNIDCELSLYSENFDLYRIGANVEVKKPPVSHKGTPIPLGPSSTIKPWSADSRKNNQYDDEDDYKRSGNDILRGSHSSNFYASSNRGRDDLDDNDYDAPNVGAKRQEVTQGSNTKKQKTLVRKLASKRPVSQKPFQQTYQQYTETPRLASSQPPRHQQSTQTYNQAAFGSFGANTQPPRPQQSTQTYNQAAFGSFGANKTPKSRGNVNFNSYTNKPYQQQDYQRVTTTTAPTIYQRINNLTEVEVDNSQETVTPTYDVNRTYENSYNFRQQTNAFNKQKIPAPKPNTYSSSTSQFQPVQTESSARLPSTDYLRNIAQTYQQPAAVINNQLQDTGRNNYRQTYTPYRSTQLPTTTSYPQNVYQPATGYQSTARIPQSSVGNQYYSTASPVGPSTLNPVFYQSYSTPTPYTQPNTTFDYNKYYQTSTSVSQNTNYFFKQFDTNKPVAPSQNPTQYYTSSTVYPFQQTTNTPKYNPYTNYQKVNEKYDDEEFLKTAPSSNLKPSDLNAIYNQKKQLYINATLKAAYSVDGAHKSAPSSQAKPTYSPPKATTAGFYLVTSTQKPVSYQSTSRSPVTPQHTVPAQASKFVPAAPAVPVSVNGSKSQDYDYAYYDNGGVSSEYDQIGNAEEDFARIGKVHNTKA